MSAFFIYILLSSLSLLLIIQANNISYQETTIPSCSVSPYYDFNYRPRIAIISHDSGVVTFSQNPELGARDAATILDVQIEWNKHFLNSVSKMKSDIYRAVEKVCSITFILTRPTY
jgi:hypothetical protein